MGKRIGFGTCVCAIAGALWNASAAAATAPAAGPRQMPQVIEQYTADRMSLNRIYPLILAPARTARFEKFDNDKLAL